MEDYPRVPELFECLRISFHPSVATSYRRRSPLTGTSLTPDQSYNRKGRSIYQSLCFGGRSYTRVLDTFLPSL